VRIAALTLLAVGLGMAIKWAHQMSGPTAVAMRAQLAAQVQMQRADYLKAEGDANRGPKFEELALTLQDALLNGLPPTEAEMVQTLGPPDLMQRDATGRGDFAYFFDQHGKKDAVVYFNYRGGSLEIE
jgi:hypothetical protein